jgi:uncharacterized phiE125 gp8 family phage protein
VIYPSQNKALGGKEILEYYVRQITDVDPTDEPLSLADVVIHSKIDLGSPADEAEQAYVESLFPAARKCVEDLINKPILEQEFEYGLTQFPWGSWIIEIPVFPLISVKTIKYTALDGTIKTLYDSTASPVVDDGTFTIETGCTPGAIFLKSINTWPTDILANGFPVKIRCTAGIDPVPAHLLQAMRYCFGHFYDNREPVTDGRINQPFEVPKTLDWLCNSDRFEAFS